MDLITVLLLISAVLSVALIIAIICLIVQHNKLCCAKEQVSRGDNRADKRSKIDFSKVVEMSIRRARPIHIKTPEERKRFEMLQEKHRNAEVIAMTRDDYRKYGRRLKQ